MFDSFRGENGFTLYPDHESPNSIDKNLVIVSYFCVLVAVATLLAALGFRGKEKWFNLIRASYSVAVGSIILVCIVSHSWKEGQTKVVSSPYVYRADLGFKGVVGLKIGLHSANVTLEGSYHGFNGKLHRVDYVEKLGWADFGEERESYKPALHRGLPEPVLKIMDFLTINDGGMRWGPNFHSAGQVTCALLWTAFAFWMLTNVLLFSVIIYGAYTFFLTGFALVMACVAYMSCQNEYPLYIMYEDNVLELSYGWSFWLTLVTGACTTAIGAALILMDHFLPDAVADFFHLEKSFTEELPDEYMMSAPKSGSFAGGSRIPSNISLATNMGDRKGSIFLEPERRDSNINQSLFKKVVISSHQADSSPFVNKAFEGDSGAKLNPLYLGDKIFDFSEERLKLAEMEKVCERGPFHLNEPKASLATLKELRDNHANERKSTCVKKVGKKPDRKSSTSSLQGSQPLSRPPSDSTDASRPRSKSDGATLNQLSQEKVPSISSTVVDLEVLANGDKFQINADASSNKSLEIINVNKNIAQVTETSNQLEVEVETHLPSVNDVEDAHSPPKPSFIIGDSTGAGDAQETSPKSMTSPNEEKESNAILSVDGIPTLRHSMGNEVTILIDRC